MRESLKAKKSNPNIGTTYGPIPSNPAILRRKYSFAAELNIPSNFDSSILKHLIATVYFS